MRAASPGGVDRAGVTPNDIVSRLSRLPNVEDINMSNRHILPVEFAPRSQSAARDPRRRTASAAPLRASSQGRAPAGNGRERSVPPGMELALPDPSLDDRPGWIGVKDQPAARPTRQRTASLLYGDAHRQWAARQAAVGGPMLAGSDRDAVEKAYASTGVPTWRGLEGPNASQLIVGTAATAPIVLDVIFGALLLLGDTRLTKTHAAAVVKDAGFVNRLARYPLNRCPRRTAERAHEHLTSTGLAPWSEELEATVIDECGGNPAGPQVYRWVTSTIALLSRKFGFALGDEPAGPGQVGMDADAFGLPPASFGGSQPVAGRAPSAPRAASGWEQSARNAGWEPQPSSGFESDAQRMSSYGAPRGLPAPSWSRGPERSSSQPPVWAAQRGGSAGSVPPGSFMRGGAPMVSNSLWGAPPMHFEGPPPDYAPGGPRGMGAATAAHWGAEDEW